MPPETPLPFPTIVPSPPRTIRPDLIKRSKLLGRKAKPGVIPPLENHKLALEKDIAKDVEADASARLNPPEASRPALIHRRIGDIRPGNHGRIATTDLEADIRKRGVAGVGVAALLLVIGRTPHSAIVGVDDVIRKVQERCARIGDGVDGIGDRSAPDGDAAGGEGPETLTAVHIDIGHRPRVFGIVDEAEIKGSRRAFLQVDGEQGRRQTGQDVGEEGFLRGWLDRVELVKGQAEQTVVVDILLELGAHPLGELNRLTRERGLSNGDGVGVDDTAGAALIAIGDAPGGPWKPFARRGLGRVIQRMTVALTGWGLGRENPAMPVSRVSGLARTEGTYRSDEPVSKSKVSCWPPTVMGVKYCESY